MKKLHHSLSDWDFDTDGFFYIEDALYVSSPSCLAVPDENGNDTLDWFSLKASIAPNLKQGRVIIYDRKMSSLNHILRIWFRAQSVPDAETIQDSYRAEVLTSTWLIREIVDGGWTTLFDGNLTFERQADTWYKHRFTWWTYVDATLILVLRMRWEIEIAGDWVIQFDEIIGAPRWEDSEVNLIGFNPVSSYVTTRHYVDDIEIWEVA